MGNISTKDGKVVPTDQADKKPSEPQPPAELDPNIRKSFERHLVDLPNIFTHYVIDNYGVSTKYVILCFPNGQDIYVAATDGADKLFEKSVTAEEFEELRKALDIKIKRGTVNNDHLFKGIVSSLTLKKPTFVIIDETIQNAKLSIEVTIRKIRTEIGLRMRRHEDCYEKIFSFFVIPLFNNYFEKIQNNDYERITMLERTETRLKEQLSYLEFVKKSMEEKNQKRSYETVTEAKLPEELNVEKQDIKSTDKQVQGTTSKDTPPPMPIESVIDFIMDVKKKLIAKKMINHLDVDAFNCVIKAIRLEDLNKPSIPSKVDKDLLDWVKTCSKRPHPLVLVGYFVFLKNDLLQKFDIKENVLINFLTTIETSYNENPFHNHLRAADVLQAVHYIIEEGGLGDLLRDEDLLACLLATIVLDYKHPGTNNSFQLHSSSKLAMLYNDRSVLENYHLSEAFEVLSSPENNILSSLTDDQFKDIRETIIQIVLSSDMSSHAYTLQRFNVKLGKDPNNYDTDFSSKEDVRLLLQMVIKTADICYTFRPTQQYLKWVGYLEEEFHIQGDREKNMGLHISAYMDRTKPMHRSYQRQFLSSVANPILSNISKVLPRLSKLGDFLSQNEHHWPLPSLASFRNTHPVVMTSSTTNPNASTSNIAVTNSNTSSDLSSPSK
ncbi:hypothetical protein FDP41_008401 [Naegleria fowleri]|uniref:PDEase domain-containing protein n=1 Tax=Naegleria fowleri TaxID=5763 RepID=A0A6A5BGL4_NAEFO|nr:uncharacterized protein FDP41_008401 [Naegleria fowleri]KAF0973194.1 hypothetical protein FDP41_008401 [Naegleria fowleri]